LHAQRLSISPSDRRRLKAIIADGNNSQKHAWRARIVLLKAEGIGTCHRAMNIP